MKKILGLDLGAASIGWAVIEEDSDKPSTIKGMGSRIVPLTSDDEKEFTQGKAITKNAKRTQARSMRKGYTRRRQRRVLLRKNLKEIGLDYGQEMVGMTPLQLWGLRAKAVNEKLSLAEMGRVLMHLNTKRGYRSGKSDYADKKSTNYVKEIESRYEKLSDNRQTVGEYLYDNLLSDSTFRCKGLIFPRRAYIEEFNRIMDSQKKFYPEILTEETISKLRDNIFYQRPLKSCKHLVSICEFEKSVIKDKSGKDVEIGPKVAPKTSPLFQVCKIWESINNISIPNKQGDILYITPEQKQKIFRFMNNHETMKVSDLNKILNIKDSGEWLTGKAIGKGLQGNTTIARLGKEMDIDPEKSELLRFDLKIKEQGVDEETGEVRLVIDSSCEKEPAYLLWHTLYSIEDREELDKVLKEKLEINDTTVRENLCNIDFRKAGYGNKSAKAIKKILPYLMEGLHYSKACESAGFRHSKSLTKEENAERELLDFIKPIKKNQLRQPIVEKILNQMINIVNALMEENGKFDEIHVELARSLKQSREEREKSYKNNLDNERNNGRIAEKIREYGLEPTRSRIQKYKLWEESGQRCIYCGKIVNVEAFLNGYDVEVEHIIPRSLYFDNGLSNKVCSCRECNKEKNNRTAYDYMRSQGDEIFNDYLRRINEMQDKGKISKTKLKNLLTPADKIPTDFIDRQLRESQYIAKKAKEILESVCRDVVSTSGGVTDFIRHLWGWDNVLHDLNFKRYKNGGFTEMRETDNGVSERIKNWTKRLDHRHHAIDALTIACTKRGYIQRLNSLNSLDKDDQSEYAPQNANYRNRLSKLERYIVARPHFSYNEVLEATKKIAVSLKAGKRVATFKKKDQLITLVPRGPLSEESIYGRNKRYEKNKKGDFKLKEYYVLKYPLESITERKKADTIIDKDIRQRVITRLEEVGTKNSREAFKEPLLDSQGNKIRSVRCDTRLSAVVPLRKNEKGDPISFVKPGNNHHVAIYEDNEGTLHEHVVTFWHAVERKKYGIPVIIENPEEEWNNLPENLPESFLNQLPEWTNGRLKFSLQQNEMFILGMDDDDFYYAMEQNDNAALCKHLYRVQKLSTKNYVFRYHTETSVNDKDDGMDEKISMNIGRFISIRSLSTFEKMNPHKVRVTLLGKIVET